MYLSPLDSEYLDLIREQFLLDTESTTKLALSTIKTDTCVYAVNTLESSLVKEDLGGCYILDTPQAQLIASHPHIVGDELEKLCLITANEFKSMLTEFGLVGDSPGVLHILRGSSGYMVDEVFPKLPLINVRSMYSKDGYRSHSDDSRRIEVIYNDYSGQKLDTLIVPDTYATGRSLEAALIALNKVGLKLSTLIIYGFIAIPSIQRLYKLCETIGCRLVTVALCDITQLAANNYDMTLFGPDEHLHTSTGKLNKLGSIVGNETLHDMVHNFIPGLDQPGDWSERQSILFNGHGMEPGNIRGHLTKSIAFIEELDRINQSQVWYNDSVQTLTQNELIKLRETLAKY